MVNLTGLNSLFAARLSAAIAAAEKATGAKASFSSGYRTPQEQAQIKANSLGRSVSYGGKTYQPQKTERGFKAAWPGKSLHQQGLAADLNPGPVRNWVRAHAKTYGLETISKDEPHIQIARGTLKTDYDSTPNAFAGDGKDSPAISAVNDMAAGQPARTLRKGMSGEAVRQLQGQLAAAGLYHGKIDGDYGRQTAAAVRSAESLYGLSRDKGVAGPQVLSRLAGNATTGDITSALGVAHPGGAPAPSGEGSADYLLHGFHGDDAVIAAMSGAGTAGPTPMPGLTVADTQDPTATWLRAQNTQAGLAQHPQQAQMVRDRIAGRSAPVAAIEPLSPGMQEAIDRGSYRDQRAFGGPPVSVAAGGPPSFDTMNYLEHRADTPGIGNGLIAVTDPPAPDKYASNRAYAAAHPPPTFFRGPGSGDLAPPSTPQPGTSINDVIAGVEGIPGAIFNGLFGGDAATTAPKPSPITIQPAVPPGGAPISGPPISGSGADDYLRGSAGVGGLMSQPSTSFPSRRLEGIPQDDPRSMYANGQSDIEPGGLTGLPSRFSAPGYVPVSQGRPTPASAVPGYSREWTQLAAAGPGISGVPDINGNVHLDMSGDFTRPGGGIIRTGYANGFNRPISDDFANQTTQIGIPRDPPAADASGMPWGALPSRFNAPGYAPFPSGWKQGAYASAVPNTAGTNDRKVDAPNWSTGLDWMPGASFFKSAMTAAMPTVDSVPMAMRGLAGGPWPASDAQLSGYGSTDTLRGAAEIQPSGGPPKVLTPGGPGYTTIDMTKVAPGVFSMAPAIAYTPPKPAQQITVPTKPQTRQSFATAPWSSPSAAPSYSAGASMNPFSSPAAIGAITSYLQSFGGPPVGSYVGYTPPGYHPADFDSVSGGATHAYQPNGYGGGTYVRTTDGREMSY